MRIKILITLIVLFMFSNFARAHGHELAMKIKDSQGDYVERNVMVYYYDNIFGEIEFYRSAKSCTTQCFTAPDGNFACDIDDDNSSGMSIDSLWSGTWIFRIEEDSTYLRVYIDDVAQDEEADFQIIYNGSTFTIVSDDRGVDIKHYGDWVEDDIVVKNNFTNGRIKFDNVFYDSLALGGRTFNVSSGSFPHYASSVLNQTVDNYFRKWREWSDNESTAINRTLDDPTLDYGTYEAKFAKECNDTLKNDFGISGNGGTIYLDDSQKSSPYATALYDDTDYKLEAPDQNINCVNYEFDHWEFNSTNIGSQNPKTDFTPNAHGKIIAVYKGIRATNSYRSLHFNDDEPGEEVRVMWNHHPLDSTEVKEYAIWRKIRHNGVTGSPVKIATVQADSSASYSYTDTGYMISEGYNGYIYYYDVKAYYEPNETYTNDDYVAVYAEAEPNIQTEDPYQVSTGETALEIPLDYALGNYPNPFNPTTTIRYSLAENDFVTIKIYNMLGKEISTLVNKEMPAGIYNVEFNAIHLPSGVYIYSIFTNNFKQSKKMILTK